MKKTMFKPGFEFIFSLSLLAVLGLPPLVSAQNQQKDLQITINNGDTTINGKNLKDLSAADRKEALKSIGQIATINIADKDGAKKIVVITRKHKGDKDDNDVVIEQDGQGGNNGPMIVEDNGKKVRVRKVRINGRDLNDSTVAFNYRPDDAGGPDHRMEMRKFRMDIDDDHSGPRGFGRRNTQNFSYSNTDNDGVSTRVTYHVSDHPATFDYDAGKHEVKQQEMLYMTDLNIVPEFSAGKTIIMFSLPSKVAAEVQFKDDKGNLLWSEKALNGSFNKSFALGLNGLYYLQVKQGNKIIVKEIMKN